MTNADGGALTHFYLGKSYLALDRYAEALKGYESAERAGYSGVGLLARRPPDAIETTLGVQHQLTQRLALFGGTSSFGSRIGPAAPMMWIC